MAFDGIKSEKGACCIACGRESCCDLECLERPRFFAGQLLTEHELNALQDYVRAKDRLHNRLLHGWGTVCGLEVACHECEGWITVHPGYALDPCGNDIVVCEPAEFDLLGAIKACRERRRRRQRDDCLPIDRYRRNQSCAGKEERWCIAISYEERETRMKTPLRRPRKKARCCDVCGTTSGCRCATGSGCNCKSPAKCACAASRSPGGRIECEPTRILETFRIEVCEPSEDCTDLMTLLEGTMPKRIYDCVMQIFEFLLALVDESHREFGDIDTPEELHAACCEWREAVTRLYRENPFNVRCTLFHDLDQLSCPRPLPNESFDEYSERVGDSMLVMLRLIFLYVFDCVCHAFLPPCPEEPCDERVTLACVTLRDDRIVHICNLSCRRFAGSFASWRYWLPIGALIAPTIQEFCCSALPFFRTKRETVASPPPPPPGGGNAQPPSREPVPVTPMTATSRTAIEQPEMMMMRSFLRAGLGGGDNGPSAKDLDGAARDLFALPDQLRRYAQLGASLPGGAFRDLGRSLFPSLTAVADPQLGDSVALHTYARKSSTEAARELESHGLVVERRRAARADVETRLRAMSSPGRVPKSARVILYHDDRDRVVGWDTVDLRADVERSREELAAAREELGSLRDEVASLREALGSKGTTKKPRKGRGRQ